MLFYSVFHTILIVRIYTLLFYAMPAGIYLPQEGKLSGSTATDTLKRVIVKAKTKESPTLSSSPVQIISKNKFDHLGIETLSDAVKLFSGVQIKDYGGIGGVKTVSIRSIGAQHTAISYDGVTLSDAQNGQIDIGRFNLDNISGVSLVIGPSDDIFQTARMFASAGSLNIKTLKPNFDTIPFNAWVKIRGGSFGTYNPSFLYEQKISNRWSVAANADWLKSDGVYRFTLVNGELVTREKRYNSDVNTLRAELNIYGEVARNGKLSFKGSYYNSERGLPGAVILYKKDARERLWDVNSFVQVAYESSLCKKLDYKLQFKYNYAWNKYRDEKEYYDKGFQIDYYTQQEYYGSFALKYTPFSGVSFSFAEDYFKNVLDASLNNFVYPKRSTSLTVLAGQYSSDLFTFTASLLGTYITETVRYGEASADRFRLSPSVSASCKLLSDPDMRFRLSYQDLFRTPTFNDLYYAKIGNKNLKSEIARQLNVGLTGNITFNNNKFENLFFSVDAYYNKVKDKIVALPTLFIWKMMNMGRVNIIGTDVNLNSAVEWPSGLRLEFSGSYTFQYAIDVTDKESKNYKDQIPYTPRHSGNLSLSFINKWINLGYSVSIVGERYALPQNIKDNWVGGYSDHSISLWREFSCLRHKLNLQFDCKNITDKQYDVIQYYPMPGRSYMISLKITY